MDNTILNYIEKELVVSDVPLELSKEDDLLGSGLVDSLGMMKLISFLEKEYELKIPAEDMIIENFITVSAIEDYLDTKS